MILVLPGTKWSEGLCKKIKEKGHEILLVSPEEHPYCEKYADDFFRSDIFDVNGITEYCTLKDIDAVLSDECDIAMPIVADLGNRLGVHALSYEMAALYTDKSKMREFSNTIGLPNLENRKCKNVDEAIEFYESIDGDIIIKPLDSNASHGVFRIGSEQELREQFDESIYYSHAEKSIIAERYISGTEFTIDGVKTPDRHFTLAISEKKHYIHNENIAYELFFTHKNEKFDYKELKKVNDAFVMESKLEYGFTHAEYKYEKGRFYLIEIAARGGGNQISSVITQYMSGYDTYNYLIESAIGGAYNKDFSIPQAYIDKAAVLYFFHVPNGGGRVKNIIGEDFLMSNSAILDYGLNFKVGDEIHNALNDSVRIGYYIAGAENQTLLRDVMRNIDDNFHIVVEE